MKTSWSKTTEGTRWMEKFMHNVRNIYFTIQKLTYVTAKAVYRKEYTSGQAAKWRFVEQMHFLQNHFQERKWVTVILFTNTKNRISLIVMKSDISREDLHAFLCSSRHIQWYQLISHKARVFLPRLVRHTSENLPRI